jgi:hypothetical protein
MDEFQPIASEILRRLLSSDVAEDRVRAFREVELTQQRFYRTVRLEYLWRRANFERAMTTHSDRSREWNGPRAS